MPRLALRGFYAIVDVKDGSCPDGAQLRSRVDALLAAGPCCLQLRGKRLAAADLRAAAVHLLAACRATGVPFCVNDRVDVALAVGADAVHVGQEDLPLAEVRRVAAAAGRAQLWVGVSTHSLVQARAADAEGADYIGFGPVFGTRSKDNPDPAAGIGALRAAKEEVRIPVVAIGGIDLANVVEVVAAGADAAAVISAVERAVDCSTAARRIASAFMPC